MRLVIDTNVLLAAIPRRSRFYPIFNSLVSGKHEWIISHEILDGRGAQGVGAFIEAEIRNLHSVHIVDPYYKWHLIRDDYDDNKFVDAYIAGQAEYLVTEDKHFGVLKEVRWPPITVISAQQLLELINPPDLSLTQAEMNLAL